jgi:hypothetical protein
MRRVLGVVCVFVLVGLVGAAAAAAPSEPPKESPPPSQPDQPPDEPSASGQTVQGQFVPSKGSAFRIRGTAKLTRGARGNTKLSVHAAGLQPDKVYPTYVHTGACAEGGEAYKNDPNGPAEPPNALWASSDPSDPKAGLQANPSGNAKGYGLVSWVARPEAKSVVIHSSEAGNAPLACADLS